MSRDEAHLLDILDAARLVLTYVRGKDLQAFLHDVQLQDAVIRRLAVIGEAARRVSEVTRLKHPDVPWAKIIGMRNVVIHEYDSVDLTIVWEAVRKDLPPLVALLERVLPPPPSS